MSGDTPRYGPVTGRYVQTPVDWAKCGTEANAKAHYRRGEKPCDACLQAAARAAADRRKKRADA